MPWMNRRAVEIDEARIKRRTMPELRKRTEIWYRGREDGAAESRIYHIGLLDPGSQQMNNVTILSLGSDFTMRRRWDARDMRWMDAADAWRLATGVRREFRSGQPDRAETFREQTVTLPERYQDFAQVPRAPDVMSYRELRDYIERLQDAGHKVVEVPRRPPLEDRLPAGPPDHGAGRDPVRPPVPARGARHRDRAVPGARARRTSSSTRRRWPSPGRRSCRPWSRPGRRTRCSPRSGSTCISAREPERRAWRPGPRRALRVPGVARRGRGRQRGAGARSRSARRASSSRRWASP